MVILLGGRTGRDGCRRRNGFFQGAQTDESWKPAVPRCRRATRPIERKLQRLFRNARMHCRLIKRCNDFGAGGVSVAIGELADGLHIDLNEVTAQV